MPTQLGDIENASQKRRQTSFDITNTPTAQRSLRPEPGGPARAQRMQALDRSGGGGSPLVGGLPSSAGNGWTQAGNGIAIRVADGLPEFTNDSQAVAGARAMPLGGIGGGLPQFGTGAGQGLAVRGSAANIGDGIGTFSQAEAGSAQLALDRFERAGQEREKMIAASRRGQIGEGGGRVTVVRDSSRSPSIADLQNARLDARQAQTDALRSQTQEGILAGLDDRVISRLQQQRLGQQIREGERAYNRGLALEGILAGLPALQGEARVQAEREYLLRADPQAYLSAQSKAGTNQLDLEKKQLERDKLRQELDQGIGGGLKLTEQQSKDLGYYTRGNEANALLAQQGDALTTRAIGERGQARGIADAAIRGTPFLGDSAIGNSLVSTERQQAEQAGREMLAAILRKDTGAAITEQEMSIYGRMYLPQPGDSDAVLSQKAEARTRALESIRSGLGTAERKAAPLKDGRRQAADMRIDEPVRVASRDDVAALPSGTVFMGPDGIARRKP